MESNQPSINFGTQEALDHIRILTDVGAMTRLLHECIAYQHALDLNLDTLLSQRSDLDKHLSNLHRSSQVLEIIKADSDHVLSNVASTSDRVSAKVRELDLAQLLDGQDYESAAKSVLTFVSSCFL